MRYIMIENTDKNNITEVNLPLIPLRGLVGFPQVQISLEIARPISLKAFTASATMHDAKILLVAQKDVGIESPEEKDLFKIGVLAEIKHVVKNPQGTLSVVFEGISRARIIETDKSSGFFSAIGSAFFSAGFSGAGSAFTSTLGSGFSSTTGSAFSEGTAVAAGAASAGLASFFFLDGI